MAKFNGFYYTIFTELCNHYHNFRTFLSACKETFSSHSSFVPNASIPRSPQTYFLSLWICLFWTFHTNGIVQYVVFCDWLHGMQ